MSEAIDKPTCRPAAGNSNSPEGWRLSLSGRSPQARGRDPGLVLFASVSKLVSHRRRAGDHARSAAPVRRGRCSRVRPEALIKALRIDQPGEHFSRVSPGFMAGGSCLLRCRFGCTFGRLLWAAMARSTSKPIRPSTWNRFAAPAELGTFQKRVLCAPRCRQPWSLHHLKWLLAT
jgi:hypothetical protein